MTIVLHLSATRVAKVNFYLPLNEEGNMHGEKEQPSWRQGLIDAQAMFNARHELAGHVSTKTYGLARSPLGDSIVVCASNHPSNGLEYAIPALQISNISINDENDMDLDAIFSVYQPSPKHNQISDGAVFTAIKGLMERSPDSPPNVEAFLERMPCKSPQEVTNGSQTQDSDLSTSLESQVAHLRQKFVYDQESILSRNRRLVQLAQAPVAQSLKPDLNMIRRLVTTVLGLPSSLSDDVPMSAKIIKVYRVVLAKIEAREHDTDPVIETHSLERCDMCDSNIAFESLLWARCSAGHQFSRCALSFLAMQNSEAIKSCAICNTRYIDEHPIEALTQITAEPANNATESDGVEKQTSVTRQGVQSNLSEPLARILFAACDTCIRCGGNFVG